MPATLKIDNYPAINVKEKAELASEVAAGATALPLVNAQGVAADDFLYIGRLGQEKVEKRQAGVITGNSVAVTALDYAHPQYGPVLAVLGDQIQLYRAANIDGTPPADSDFSSNGSPVSIDPDNVDTQLSDSNGSSAFWYKWVYYNSDSAAEVTTLAQVNAVRGAEWGNYTTVAAIRVEARIQNNPYISDKFVSAKRAQAQDYINGQLSGTYTVPFTSDVPPQITRITELFAAGYILKGEYGTQLAGTGADGQAKIDEAQAMLDKILNGSTELLDSAGDTSATRDAVSGWPNASTATTDVKDGGSKRRHRMGHKF